MSVDNFYRYAFADIFLIICMTQNRMHISIFYFCIDLILSKLYSKIVRYYKKKKKIRVKKLKLIFKLIDQFRFMLIS